MRGEVVGGGGMRGETAIEEVTEGSFSSGVVDLCLLDASE